MKQAVAIRHIAFEDLGNLTPILQQTDYTMTYLEASPRFLDGVDALEPDLVIVLGGPIGAYDEQDYPFLIDEIRFLEQRLAKDLPTLGICLGAQLMARTLGAKVYPGSGKEIGWYPLKLSVAGQQSPLSYLASNDTLVLHWHGDTFDLPTGCTHLASSSQYQNQAFIWGECGLALQFHPEVTAQGLEHWFIGHACEIAATSGISVAQLRADTARSAQDLSNQAAKFWHNWLKTLDDKILARQTQHNKTVG